MITKLWKLSDQPYTDFESMRERFKKVPIYFYYEENSLDPEHRILEAKVLVEETKRILKQTTPVKISVELLNKYPHEHSEIYLELPINDKKTAMMTIGQRAQGLFIKLYGEDKLYDLR